MNKTIKKPESSSVKDAMKEFYAAEKVRRSTSNSPNNSGKFNNVKKSASPSSVVTGAKPTPRNDDDNFGNQLSKIFFGSPSADVNSVASSCSDVLSNVDDSQTEVLYLKNEMISLQELLEDSMGTLVTLNEKVN